MENKETKNNTAEELNDEALDEVTGGVYQLQDITHGSIAVPQSPQSKKSKTPSVTVPTMPNPGSIRKF